MPQIIIPIHVVPPEVSFVIWLEGASIGCAWCINSQPTRPSDETYIKPRFRVERLPPSSHVKEPSVTAHYDEWSIGDLLHWLNKLSVPFLYPGVPVGLTPCRGLVPLWRRNLVPILLSAHTLGRGRPIFNLNKHKKTEIKIILEKYSWFLYCFI
jgi:hypothetical protein